MIYHDPHNPFRQSLTAHLRGDPRIVDLFDRVIPENRAYPYALMGETSATPDRNKGRVQWDLEQELLVVSKYEGTLQGNEELGLIMERVCDTDLTLPCGSFYATFTEVLERRTSIEPGGPGGAELYVIARVRARFLVIDNSGR